MIVVLKEKVNWIKLKYVMVSTLFFGLVAHGYAYFNSNFSQDSICSLYIDSPDVMISVGRFLRPVYRWIRGGFALPVLSGVLSLLFFGLAIYLIIDALRINKKTSIVLSTGILLTSSSITLLTATFMHDIDSYAFSMLLVSLGIWSTVKTNRGIYFSPVLYFLSLGLYQAYINIPVFVFLVLALYYAIQGENIKRIILDLLKRIAMIAVSMIAYFVAYKIVLSVTGIAPLEIHNSPNNVLDISLTSIISRIIRTFNSEFRWFFLPKNHYSMLNAILNVLILVLSVVMLVYLIKKNREKMAQNGILFIACIILLMPFGINVITLVSNQWHDLTIFSLFLFYVFFIFLYERTAEVADWKTKQINRFSIVLLLSIIIFNNCIYSNEAYLKKELESQATLSTFTRLIDRIEQTDGYEVCKTPVVLVGTFDNSNIAEKRKGFDERGLGLNSIFATTYWGSYEAYFNNYLNYPINLLSENDSLIWQTNESVKAMPAFPHKDCCKIIDGTMIVKLSEMTE